MQSGTSYIQDQVFRTLVDSYGKRFAVCLIVPGFLSAVMLLNDSEGLQQFSRPYGGLTA